MEDWPGALYVEVGVGVLLSDQTLRDPAFEAGFDVTGIDTDLGTQSRRGGVGLTIPVTERTRVRPLLVGVAGWLSNDADFNGTGGAQLDELTRGIVFSWNTTTVGAGAALAL